MSVKYVSKVPRRARKLGSLWRSGYRVIVFRSGRDYYALIDLKNKLYNLVLKTNAERPREAISLFLREIGVADMLPPNPIIPDPEDEDPWSDVPEPDVDLPPAVDPFDEPEEDEDDEEDD
ncbi:MAG: hypothetical protein QXJ48_03900 [Candidatus Korarchaeum sp.]